MFTHEFKLCVLVSEQEGKKENRRDIFRNKSCVQRKGITTAIDKFGE